MPVISQTPPLLRWAGSKRQIIPLLRNHIPPHFNRYIEPFAGSACLFFAINPRSAIVGDINSDLISTYIAVRDNPEKVAQTLHSFRKGKAAYISLRSRNYSTHEKQAAKFIYLNRYCFNGLYRTNKKGIFNVPYGGIKSGKLPDKESLQKYSQLLSNAQFCAGTFERTLSLAENGDFVYIDPPYRVNGVRVFHEYSAMQFTELDLVAVRSALISLNSKGVKFLVSYAYSNEGKMLANGFNRKIVSVRRNIAGFASERHASKEILISNYEN